MRAPLDPECHAPRCCNEDVFGWRWSATVDCTPNTVTGSRVDLMRVGSPDRCRSTCTSSTGRTAVRTGRPSALRAAPSWRWCSGGRATLARSRCARCRCFRGTSSSSRCCARCRGGRSGRGGGSTSGRGRCYSRRRGRGGGGGTTRPTSPSRWTCRRRSSGGGSWGGRCCRCST